MKNEVAKQKTAKKDVHGMSSWRFWLIVLGMGMAGQLCWHIENQCFTTFVYAKISGNVSLVTTMVIVSALVTTVSTFIFGTLSDRMGKRKVFVSYGYIIWGVATILFGMTEFVRQSQIGGIVVISGFLVVFSDAFMSFFGSMGYDSGYNAWLNDYTDDSNKGQVGSALASLPVLGTIVGTLLGGMIVNIGNPTVGVEGVKYDPSQDNYQLLFWLMGIFVIAFGVGSLWLMKDEPNLKPHKDGSFGKQLLSVFNFSSLKGNANIKELLLANVVVCLFFIPFNFYFTHMGNWIVYDLGFTMGDMGLIEGIALIFAVFVTFPFAKLINKNKIPLVAFIAIVVNAIGLFMLYTFVKGPQDVNSANLFSAKNIMPLICVFLIGTGYVLIMQTGMIWVRGLFPEKSKGQFEGVRVIFFVLLPMLIGTLVGNIIIKNTPQDVIIKDSYGIQIDVPKVNLFLFAGIMVLFALIPLYFAAKCFNKRQQESLQNPIADNAEQQTVDSQEQPIIDGIEQ